MDSEVPDAGPRRSRLPTALAEALEDESYDAEIRAETDEALAQTGKDVGTPIIHFEPPSGVAFSGPVISRLPREDQSLELWNHVIGLARFPGFAEIKRSMRELPQLRALGVSEDEVGIQQDWHGGSRRQKEYARSVCGVAARRRRIAGKYPAG